MKRKKKLNQLKIPVNILPIPFSMSHFIYAQTVLFNYFFYEKNIIFFTTTAADECQFQQTKIRNKFLFVFHLYWWEFISLSKLSYKTFLWNSFLSFFKIIIISTLLAQKQLLKRNYIDAKKNSFFIY